jgi:hypothetical protein
VIDAVAENVVDLDRVCGRPVDQRGRTYGCAPTERETGLAIIELFYERAFEEGRRRDLGAGQRRRVPVDHRALRVVQHLAGERLRARALGECGEMLDDVHPLTRAPDACTRFAGDDGRRA